MQITDAYIEIYIVTESILQALDVIGKMFISMFKGLQAQYSTEIEIVNKQYPAEPFKFIEPGNREEQW